MPPLSHAFRGGTRKQPKLAAARLPTYGSNQSGGLSSPRHRRAVLRNQLASRVVLPARSVTGANICSSRWLR
jgi:hypothetical protein